MGFMKTIIWGRDDGIRSKLRGLFSGGSTPVDTSPDSAYSAPSSNSMSGVMVGGATKMEAPKDVNPPDGYEVVLHKDALAPGEVTEVIIGGTRSHLELRWSCRRGFVHSLENTNVCPNGPEKSRDCEPGLALLR